MGFKLEMHLNWRLILIKKKEETQIRPTIKWEMTINEQEPEWLCVGSKEGKMKRRW